MRALIFSATAVVIAYLASVLLFTHGLRFEMQVRLAISELPLIPIMIIPVAVGSFLGFALVRTSLAANWEAAVLGASAAIPGFGLLLELGERFGPAALLGIVIFSCLIAALGGGGLRGISSAWLTMANE